MPDACYTICAQQAGDRLDHCLAELCGLSLRACRRLVEDKRVLLNNRLARAGQRVREGDTVRIAHSPGRSAAQENEEDNAQHGARLLQRNGDFAFLYKPPLLHTVHLAGRNNASLEDVLKVLLPGETEARLLQRLDHATSGIVACALNADAERTFRKAEQSGSVDKYYLCLVRGRLERPLRMKARLCGSGPRVLAMKEESSDPARWTDIAPLKILEAGEAEFFQGPGEQDAALTLAGCRIHRGFRHQIRAHCALAGYPLVNDVLYGAQNEEKKLASMDERAGHFFLHHARLEFARNVVTCLPDWLSCIPKGTNEAHKWFAQKGIVG